MDTLRCCCERAHDQKMNTKRSTRLPNLWTTSARLHVLNNFLRGPYITREDCRLAAKIVVGELHVLGGGYEESLSNHLDTTSGWLSADVINVLGAANFNLHVDGCLERFRLSRADLGAFRIPYPMALLTARLPLT